MNPSRLRKRVERPFGRSETLVVIVLAKPPMPGQVKTRLVDPNANGSSSHGWACEAYHAAAYHAAMMQCVLNRVRRLVRGTHVLALPGGQATADQMASETDPVLQVDLTGWTITDQGEGSLGERMNRLWQQYPDTPVAFLGTDSPDIPAGVLMRLNTEIQRADALVGPVEDGGYWTLGSQTYRPQLLENIDWGTPEVYHQTVDALTEQRVDFINLPIWADIDTLDDLIALRDRLENVRQDADLITLTRRIDQTRFTRKVTA